jgi:hypothetical protein
MQHFRDRIFRRLQTGLFLQCNIAIAALALAGPLGPGVF